MGSVFGKTSDYESPKFKLLSKTDNYEIRSYSETIAIDGPTSQSNDGNGFGNLAKYIGVGSTPYNENREAISMTTPVVTYNTQNNNNNDNDNNTNTRMQFILPSKLENPPNPLNKALQIIHRESAIFAVTTFSGLINHQESIEKKDEFIELLKKDKIAIIEPIEWEFWRFNPPWTVPWLRTNEIAVKLDKNAYEKNEDKSDEQNRCKM